MNLRNLYAVRFGSSRHMQPRRHVRFTPESERMRCNSPCPLRANSESRRQFGPQSLRKRNGAPVLTAGEHDAWCGADVPATDRKRRSTGSDCTSPDYRPARSADILRPSDTRSSTAYHRRPSTPPRTMELRSSLLPPAEGQWLKKQERQPRKPCGSSLTSLLAACNNTELPMTIPRRQPRL